MTIIEALKSKKPFKRKDWEEWINYDPIKWNGWFHGIEDGFTWGSTTYDLYYEDFLAEDWEIND